MSQATYDLAKEIEAVRCARRKHFGPGIFDEQAWDFLLLLYIAAEEGREVRREDAISQVVGSEPLLERWLKVLEAEGAIEIKAGTGVICLSPEGERKMLETLASAQISHMRLAAKETPELDETKD